MNEYCFTENDNPFSDILTRVVSLLQIMSFCDKRYVPAKFSSKVCSTLPTISPLQKRIKSDLGTSIVDLNKIVYESFSDVGEIRVYFASKILTPCRMH